MLGLQDGWVAAAYISCLLSSALCVVYGLINWNRGDQPLQPGVDDEKWANDEVKIEEDL